MVIATSVCPEVSAVFLRPWRKTINWPIKCFVKIVKALWVGLLTTATVQDITINAHGSGFLSRTRDHNSEESESDIDELPKSVDNDMVVTDGSEVTNSPNPLLESVSHSGSITQEVINDIGSFLLLLKSIQVSRGSTEEDEDDSSVEHDGSLGQMVWAFNRSSIF